MKFVELDVGIFSEKLHHANLEAAACGESLDPAFEG
jgi:hypothetical protein